MENDKNETKTSQKKTNTLNVSSPGRSRTDSRDLGIQPTTVTPATTTTPVTTIPGGHVQGIGARSTLNGVAPAYNNDSPVVGMTNAPVNNGTRSSGSFNYGAVAQFAAGLSLEHFSHLSVSSNGEQQHHHHQQQQQQHHHGQQFDLSSVVEDSVLATAASLISNQLSPQEPTYVNL